MNMTKMIDLRNTQGNKTIPYAEFIGKQDDFKGGTLAYYNIVGGPKNGATVTARILRELGIEVPKQLNNGR